MKTKFKLAVAMDSGTGTLTVKNGKGKQIDITDSDGTIISEAYTKTTKLNNFVEEINANILSSDNYIDSSNTELGSILNTATNNPIGSDELYNMSVDAALLTKITFSVYKKANK